MNISFLIYLILFSSIISIAIKKLKKTDMQNEEADCVTFYTECNYQGESYRICNSETRLPDEWNDRFNSMIAGSNVKGLRLEDQNYVGYTFPFDLGAKVSCFEDHNMESKTELKNKVSSVLFNGTDCVIMRYRNKSTPDINYTKTFCPFEHDLNLFDIDWNSYTYFEVKTFKNNIKAIFYSDYDEKGESWTIEGDLKYEEINETNKPPISSIKSFSINKEEKLQNGNLVRYVVIQASDVFDHSLNFSQVLVRNKDNINFAQGKPVTATSVLIPSTYPEQAVDGNIAIRNHPNIFHSAEPSGDKFTVDLLEDIDVKDVLIYNRGDCCQNRIVGAKVILLDSNKNVIKEKTINESSQIVGVNFE